jgi:hypothetical protein
MSKVALYVPPEAKPDKEKDVAEFLKSALPLVDAEPGAIHVRHSGRPVVVRDFRYLRSTRLAAMRISMPRSPPR